MRRIYAQSKSIHDLPFVSVRLNGCRALLLFSVSFSQRKNFICLFSFQFSSSSFPQVSAKRIENENKRRWKKFNWMKIARAFWIWWRCEIWELCNIKYIFSIHKNVNSIFVFFFISFDFCFFFLLLLLLLLFFFQQLQQTIVGSKC